MVATKLTQPLSQIDKLNAALEAMNCLPDGYAEKESPRNGTCLPASLTMALNGLRPDSPLKDPAELLSQVV